MEWACHDLGASSLRETNERVWTIYSRPSLHPRTGKIRGSPKKVQPPPFTEGRRPALLLIGARTGIGQEGGGIEGPGRDTEEDSTRTRASYFGRGRGQRSILNFGRAEGTKNLRW